MPPSFRLVPAVGGPTRAALRVAGSATNPVPCLPLVLPPKMQAQDQSVSSHNPVASDPSRDAFAGPTARLGGAGVACLARLRSDSRPRALQVEKFVPKDNVKIETDPEAKEGGDGSGGGGHQDDESRIAALCAQLDGVRQQLPPGFRVSPVLFEKDDDSNFHMDLITALANMRARNYGIPEVRHFHTCMWRMHVAMFSCSSGIA